MIGKILKKAFAVVLYCLVCAFAILSALEIIYRTQAVDTYLPELKSYNRETLDPNLSFPDGCVLVLGDSFTAGGVYGHTYVDELRVRMPGTRVINAGIVGTGVVQALITAPRRLKEFKPKAVVYQVFVGNDLFNIRYPVDWRQGIFVRNVYWAMERYFRCLGFIAYRMSQLKFVQEYCARNKIENNAASMASEVFDAENYNAFARAYIDLSPSYLDDTVLLKSRYAPEYAEFLRGLESLAAMCRNYGAVLHIVVVPHPCQVSRAYYDDIIALGGEFDSGFEAVNENEYPFIKGIREKFKERDQVSILNPIGILKDAEAQGKRAYYANDPHLSETGQRSLGEFVYGSVFGN